MVDTIKLYISAADDLQIERDFLSRMVTEIPVTLGWRIILSPLKGKKIDEIFVEGADIHILVLGTDIRAPIGFEWFLSRRAGKTPILFFKKNVRQTYAARDFIRTLSHHGSWLTYDSLAGFRIQSLHRIGNLLLKNADYFDLRPAEMEKLSSFLKDNERIESNQVEVLDGGAGDNSVIISPERYIPKDGVLIRVKRNDADSVDK